ncbi:MAG: rhomboid family intramembrane serine protease [Bdellovibrionales bacterium]|nr:rhomboid family intramembrane serine protease [Bdellovibrionales bacterium]
MVKQELHRDSTLFLVGLILVNILIYLYSSMLSGWSMNIDSSVLIRLGADVPSLTTHGQWWRMLTSSFLHSNFMHLASNMIGIAFLFPYLAGYFSNREISLIYFGAIFLGSLLSLALGGDYLFSVGASAGVFGLFSAFLIAAILNKDLSNIPPRVLFAAAQTLLFHMGFQQEGIDAWAHLGGAMAGGGLCLLLLTLTHYTLKEKSLMTSGALALFVFFSIFLMPAKKLNSEKIFQHEMALLNSRMNNYKNQIINQAFASPQEEAHYIKTVAIADAKKQRQRIQQLPVLAAQGKRGQNLFLKLLDNNIKQLRYLYSYVASQKTNPKMADLYLAHASRMDDECAKTILIIAYNHFGLTEMQKLEMQQAMQRDYPDVVRSLAQSHPQYGF